MKELDVTKLGFNIIRKIDTNQTHKLGIYLAEKITAVFPYLDYSAIVDRITNCSIYVAEMPERYSSANYIYQNFSIYISKSTNLDNPDIYFMHELMHYLQDSRHYNGDLHRMGLCHFNTLKISGLALNEAAIQYVVSRINNEHFEKMHCFGIDLCTYSKNYYPILSNLLIQITHIFDESYIIKSLFRNDHSFENAFCELCHNSLSYRALKANMDIMLGCRDVIIDNSVTLKKEDLDAKQVLVIKNINEKSYLRIQKSFFVVQNLLIKSYYKAMLRNIGYRMKADEFPIKVKELESYLGVSKEHPEYSKYEEYSKYYLAKWEKKYLHNSK